MSDVYKENPLLGLDSLLNCITQGNMVIVSENLVKAVRENEKQKLRKANEDKSDHDGDKQL